MPTPLAENSIISHSSSRQIPDCRSSDPGARAICIEGSKPPFGLLMSKMPGHDRKRHDARRSIDLLIFVSSET